MPETPRDPSPKKGPAQENSVFRSRGELETRIQRGQDQEALSSGDVAAFQRVLPERYQIVREIGQGGMGQVLLAIDRGPTLKDQEYVAIKRMLGPVLSDSAAMDRFLAEVKLARSVRHPNVVKMYHSENTPLGPYIVMEYIDGIDLEEYLRRKGPLNEGQALSCFRKLAAALDEGHRQGIIHRDLKPRNILVSRAGEPYLVDFGIARRLSESDKTGAGLGAGTLAYMSPEQLENRKPDAKQDIYSLGATLFHAVEGRPPFEAESVPKLIAKIMSERAPRATRVSGGFADRIGATLEKDPSLRPASCQMVLHGLAKSSGQDATPPTFRAVPAPPVIEASLRTDAENPPNEPSSANNATDLVFNQIDAQVKVFKNFLASQPKARKLWMIGGCVLLFLIWNVSSWLLPKFSRSTSNDPLMAYLEAVTRNSIPTNPTAPPESLPGDFGSYFRSLKNKNALDPASVKPLELIPLPRLTNSIGMQFVQVPAGEFQMGSPPSEAGSRDDEKRHTVTITESFYMGIYEVTQGQYLELKRSNPSEFQGVSIAERHPETKRIIREIDSSEHPVDKVSHKDAELFCKLLSELPEEKKKGRRYRLPTEAEWEYACRAGSTTAYCFGDDERLLQYYGWFTDNSLNKTNAVGKKFANAWGLYDMHGNVSEWCQDQYGPYSSDHAINPVQPYGSSLVHRGGGWNSSEAACRSAYRDKEEPSTARNFRGFRVVISAYGLGAN